MKLDKADELGFHALYLMEEKVALEDLKTCCSSEDTSSLEATQKKLKAASFLEATPISYKKDVKFFTENKAKSSYKQMINPKNAFVLKYETWVNSDFELLERVLWRHTSDVYEFEVHHRQDTKIYKLISQNEGFLPRSGFSKLDHSIIGSLARFHSYLPLTKKGRESTNLFLEPLLAANASAKAQIEIRNKIYDAKINDRLDELEIDAKLKALADEFKTFNCSVPLGKKKELKIVDCSLRAKNISMLFKQENPDKQEYKIQM